MLPVHFWKSVTVVSRHKPNTFAAFSALVSEIFGVGAALVIAGGKKKKKKGNLDSMLNILKGRDITLPTKVRL